MAGLNARESRRQVDYDKVDEIDEGNFGDFVQAASRPDARRHAVANIVNYVREQGVPNGHEDDLLDVAHGALDNKRPIEERADLVTLGTLLVLRNVGGDGFTSQFCEAIGKQLPDVLMLDHEAESTAIAMLNAIIICEALESNAITVAPNTKLNDWLSAFKVPKHSPIAVAFLRCLATISDTEKSSKAVCEALRHELQREAENLQHTVGVVKSLLIAFEQLEDKSQLQYSHLVHLETHSGKEMGGREARKELNSVLRSAEDLMARGKGPEVKLSFALPGTRGDKLDLEIDTYTNLAVLEAVRSAAGDLYYMLIRESDVLRAYFGLDEEDSLRLDRMTRTHVRNQAAREEQYERLVAEKGRGKDRTRARDRKHAEDQEDD